MQLFSLALRVLVPYRNIIADSVDDLFRANFNDFTRSAKRFISSSIYQTSGEIRPELVVSLV